MAQADWARLLARVRAEYEVISVSEIAYLTVRTPQGHAIEVQVAKLAHTPESAFEHVKRQVDIYDRDHPLDGVQQEERAKAKALAAADRKAAGSSAAR